jgi:pimeloyl-ACP methyl ester carboxylesterase
MESVTEGRLSTGVPYLRLGRGPALVVASGLTPQHESPRGLLRRMSLAWAAPFADHFTVYLVNRRAGLAPGTTMTDIAADYAGAIEEDIGGPVLLHGTSTGGSVALQLAIDRPELVQRLVLAAAGHRLSAHGRLVQREVATLVEKGDVRQASAVMMGTLARGPLTYPVQGIGWLAGRRVAAHGLTDMVRTIRAEDSFDAEEGLSRVAAPTLVLGGTADPYCSEDLFRRTADGIPNGRAVIFRGKSHGYVAGGKVPAAVALGFLLGG